MTARMGPNVAARAAHGRRGPRSGKRAIYARSRATWRGEIRPGVSPRPCPRNARFLSQGAAEADDSWNSTGLNRDRVRSSAGLPHGGFEAIVPCLPLRGRLSLGEELGRRASPERQPVGRVDIATPGQKGDACLAEKVGQRSNQELWDQVRHLINDLLGWAQRRVVVRVHSPPQSV